MKNFINNIIISLCLYLGAVTISFPEYIATVSKYQGNYLVSTERGDWLVPQDLVYSLLREYILLNEPYGVSLLQEFDSYYVGETLR